RYTHRVAISNHRLVSLVEQKVTFRWRDSAHNNQQKLMTLALDEFLRRFLFHLLPRGFVRIRSFGFLANRRRATLLPLCQRLLPAHPMPPPPPPPPPPSPPPPRRPPPRPPLPPPPSPLVSAVQNVPLPWSSWNDFLYLRFGNSPPG